MSCMHVNTELVDELKPGWGVYACAECGEETQGSTWERYLDAADDLRKSRRENGEES